MELLIRYKPMNDDWYEWSIEENISIKKQRNKASVCNLQIPNTFATTKASSYADVQVLLNNQYLFDGKSENKGYGKDKHKLTAYDFLWDFNNERRIMIQGTTAITPTQAFTDVFDSAATSSYFAGDWGETYTGPWLDGYNATRFIVPAQTAATYGFPFFDCTNQSGTEFMKFLADLCYRGDKYRYFYWYENIGGNKYLFFEPDGWGTTHKDLDYTVTQDLQESTADILNNIVVWGKPTAGYFPADQDYWTEKNLDGWIPYVVNGTINISIDPTIKTFGSASYRVEGIATPGLICSAGSYRNFSSKSNDYINLNILDELHFYYYVDNQTNTNYHVYFEDSAANIVRYDCVGAAGAWHEVTITGKDVADGWDHVDVAFDWAQVNQIDVVQVHLAVELTRNFYLDNFYIKLNPAKSQNISTATGYDSISAGKYRKRTPEPINFPWLIVTSDCDSYASILVNYYKDPQYKISMKFNDFMNFKLNDNINFTEYQKNITLPIDEISWDFKPEGEIETSVRLGLPRFKLGDTLGKFSRDVVKPSKDWGLNYHVF